MVNGVVSCIVLMITLMMLEMDFLASMVSHIGNRENVGEIDKFFLPNGFCWLREFLEERENEVMVNKIGNVRAQIPMCHLGQLGCKES
jgi:hypothetical protein